MSDFRFLLDRTKRNFRKSGTGPGTAPEYLLIQELYRMAVAGVVSKTEILDLVESC